MNTVFVFNLKGEVTECLPTAAGSQEKRKWAFSLDKRWSLTKRTRFLCSFCEVKRSRGCPLQLDHEKRRRAFRNADIGTLELEHVLCVPVKE